MDINKNFEAALDEPRNGGAVLLFETGDPDDCDCGASRNEGYLIATAKSVTRRDG